MSEHENLIGTESGDIVVEKLRMGNLMGCFGCNCDDSRERRRKDCLVNMKIILLFQANVVF